MNERDYTAGSRMAWRQILGAALRNLGYSPALKAARLVAEREDAVAQLRRLCERYGDNDWEDNLHLGDVIEKHLGRHLEEPRP